MTEIAAIILAPIFGLFGVLVGSWQTRRQSDYEWIRNQRKEKYSEFIALSSEIRNYCSEAEGLMILSDREIDSRVGEMQEISDRIKTLERGLENTYAELHIVSTHEFREAAHEDLGACSELLGATIDTISLRLNGELIETSLFTNAYNKSMEASSLCTATALREFSPRREAKKIEKNIKNGYYKFKQ